MRKIFLLMSMLFLCGCQKKEVSTPDYTKFTIHGVEMTVPFPVGELDKLGYSLVQRDRPSLVRGEDNVAYYRNADDEILTVNVGTYSVESEFSEGYVFDILADTMNTPSSDMAVYMDVALGDSQEQVSSKYGSAVIEQDGLAMYTLMNEDGTSGTYVALIDGKVVRIEVMDTDGFVYE